MTAALAAVLESLRSSAGPVRRSGLTGSLAEGLDSAAVNFAAIGGRFERRWFEALSQLQRCIRPLDSAGPEVLLEGGSHAGALLESTGTVSAEVLTRFSPKAAHETLSLFVDNQRSDGLLPCEVSAEGPRYTQLLLGSPLARSVLNHYRLNRDSATPDDDWLGTMYRAMSRYDEWISQHRNTRGTGAVEAFCAFDAGYDPSPRFWFVPEQCANGDASQYDSETSTLPYLSPDLTANIACQREYLGRIARQIGQSHIPWVGKWSDSIDALFEHCFSPEDDFFYDLDVTGTAVRVQSDVLLRVVACEVGDEELFDTVVERYLMNTSKFLAHYGFTSIALDDPRCDADSKRHPGMAAVSLLSLLRAPQAFEHRGRTAELALTARPVFAALTAAEEFPQSVDPFSGEVGSGAVYSPSVLWYLDAVERYFGILPVSGTKRSWAEEDGEPGIWFTGLAPTRSGAGHGKAAEAIAYARTTHGRHYELAADDEQVVTFQNGSEHLKFPRGWRVETDAEGVPVAAVGVSPGAVSGHLHHRGKHLGLTLQPNERVELQWTAQTPSIVSRWRAGFTPPQTGPAGTAEKV